MRAFNLLGGLLKRSEAHVMVVVVVIGLYTLLQGERVVGWFTGAVDSRGEDGEREQRAFKR